MTSDYVLIYVPSDAGDMATRQLAWDLLARNWVVRATYLDGAELFLKEGKGKITHGERTLVLLCEASNVDRVFEHLGPTARAVAVPVLRATL